MTVMKRTVLTSFAAIIPALSFFYSFLSAQPSTSSGTTPAEKPVLSIRIVGATTADPTLVRNIS
ncbi:MAG TPA: hypothetical protein VI546_06675, partial [candidate division Zixibacteria bacterium]|nr:hypothetical protein [candidate division Zixibacteria bacterium]